MYFKLLLYSLLMLTSYMVFGQRTSTFEGPFNNGLPAKGQVRYNYYLDAKGLQIKHGGFRYLVKEKTSKSRFLHSFQGEYSHGFKDGPWEYSIKLKDYGRDLQGFATTSNIVLKANYKNGIPDGAWYYKALIYKRKQINKAGEWSWLDRDTIKNIRIQINFNNGVLVDSLQIIDYQGLRIDAIMNAEGFIKDKFIENNHGETIVMEYKNAFRYIRSKSGKTKVFPDNQCFMDLENQKDKDLMVVKKSRLGAEDNAVSKLLDDNVFNADYFLYRYIDGEKLMKLDTRGRLLSYAYKGLYYNSLRVEFTKGQLEIEKAIYYYLLKINERYKNTQRHWKNNKSDKELRKSYQELKQLNDKQLIIQKLLRELHQEIEVQKVVNSADKQYPWIRVGGTQIHSRRDYLNHLLSKAKVLNIEADKLSR